MQYNEDDIKNLFGEGEDTLTLSKEDKQFFKDNDIKYKKTKATATQALQ